MKTPAFKHGLLAVAAALMTVSAPLASAEAATQNRPSAERQDDRAQGPSRSPAQNRNDDRYGRWDSSWGARPAAPPRHFTRTSDWYRHVRACQQRYRSYDARTDRYTVRRGQTAVCRL